MSYILFERMILMKNSITAILLGGYDSTLTTLIIFIMIDLITGMMCAAMSKSSKTKDGRFSSRILIEGLFRKFCILLLVIVAVRIDLLLKTNYVRNTICFTFCANELSSILQNTTLIELYYPPFFKKIITLLKKKSSETQNGTSQEK